jgi:DNA-binding IclR family transcriptional regulator
MNEVEYDIIDELYFVTAFAELGRQVGLPEADLGRHLQELVVRGYVKCFFPDPDTEIPYEAAAFAQGYRQYYFLATKAGLVAHNSR